MAIKFKRAVKSKAKGRVALVGPAGSGKTYTALVLATLLKGDGKIAAVDTEHGSMSKYAHTDKCGGPGACKAPDHFDFDVIELDSFSPENFHEALKLAESEGYTVFLTDSLSHFWVGKDGALEFVDVASARSKDKMNGWKEFRPHERRMVDAMIASPCHVICTMRTKTEYAETEVDGKKRRVKIGLAPVQRDGLEYEFDLVAYMDDENNLIVDKTRCFTYANKTIPKPTPDKFKPFVDWLDGAAPVERKQEPPKVAAAKQQSKDGDTKASVPEGGVAQSTTTDSTTGTQAGSDVVVNYVTPDQAKTLADLVKAKGVNTKQFTAVLKNLGYERVGDTNPYLCIVAGEMYDKATKWVNEYQR